MKKIIPFICAALFTTAMAINIQYAIDDYGILKGSLHTEVLAQNTGTGTGSGSGSGSGNPVLWVRVNDDCVYKFKGKANATITVTILGAKINIKLDANGEATYESSGSQTDCTAGGQQQCEAKYCPAVIW